MAQKSYSKEFRESAVRMVLEGQRSIRETAKNLGVVEGTLRYWIKLQRRNSGTAEEKSLVQRVRELEAENQKLRLEREILKKSGGLLRQGTAAMKFAFIREHQAEFQVAAQCRVLGVSTSGFYRWRGEPVGRRQARLENLAAAIARVHAANRGVYGSPRVQKALAQEGRTVCRNTVAKVMKVLGIRAKTHRRFRVRTTDSNHTHPIAPNVLDRHFTTDRPDRVWLTDVTYIPTAEGFLYLAGVMDLYSRRIIGWSMAAHLRSDLVCEALNMAIRARRPSAGLLHHSDRGTQYACGQYQELLKAHGITVSMSNARDCYDNAPKESFWARLKTELVHHERFATRAQARAALFDYIETFYNRVRLHSSLGYVSPERFEEGVT